MIVFDASAVLEVLLRTDAGRRIEDRVFGSGETLHAPHLLDVEVAHVLRRYTLRRELTASQAEARLELFGQFPIRRYSHEPLLSRMWTLRANLTAYDAAYVALAEALRATLVTRDERVASVKGHTARVELLVVSPATPVACAPPRDGANSVGQPSMKITRILAYRVELPLHETTYKWSGGKSVTVFDSTIVRVETDAGLVGHGEVCPLGPFYLPAYAEGVRAGLRELGPHLLGEDPRQLAKLNRTMDAALKGHPYVKSGIDIACWDILGQAPGMPVCELLGGRYGEDVHLYRAISQESPEEMAAKVAGYRAEGYRRFQLKVGGDPDMDIARIHAVAAKLQPGDRLVADANTGWVQHEAVRVVEGRARRGCLHRAAVPHVRGMPRRAPAMSASVRAR